MKLQDVMLIGFADLQIASLMTPQLTTVRQNREQIAVHELRLRGGELSVEGALRKETRVLFHVSEEV